MFAFINLECLILKFKSKYRGHRRIKINSLKGSSQDSVLPDFRIYYQAIIKDRMWNKYEDKLIHEGMRWFPPGFRAGREKWFKKTQEWNSAQSYFIIVSVGPVLLLSGPNNFTLALIYHSTILGKNSNYNELKCMSATKLEIWLLWRFSYDFIHPLDGFLLI